MISIGRFEIEHDNNGWILWEKGTSVSRDTKELKEKRRPRYYATMEQCFNKVIDLSAVDADSASSVVDAIQSAKCEIIAAIKRGSR